eukprot:CAMPEP_0173414712 /NCGR_PEP_ID=MMETSP1356-20130122/84477_1 /TAXON_ID=77927 ORGANISM="Hemiselmis virescens, Strain PCC157" /NCGR_SAMPLE_ID=MMETSP1356 /ASSEMBLY_ACC=CAM_ASM_000847 /LENGTH=75 /DNA_ID=CAMNT_0014376915 /DNA_START=1135 /DNA_END=1359 /DNA_ORIENTATION=-
MVGHASGALGATGASEAISPLEAWRLSEEAWRLSEASEALRSPRILRPSKASVALTSPAALIPSIAPGAIGPEPP